MYNEKGAKIDGLIIADELSWSFKVWNIGGGDSAIKKEGTRSGSLSFIHILNWLYPMEEERKKDKRMTHKLTRSP